MDRRIAYARILLRGRAGYGLKASKENPRVKRWQKLERETAPKRLPGKPDLEGNVQEKQM